MIRLRPAASRLAQSAASSWTRRYSSAAPRVASVAEAKSASLDLETFREHAFLAGKPLLVRNGENVGGGTPKRDFPATRRWFNDDFPTTLSSYLAPHAMAMLPYEMYPVGTEVARFVGWLEERGSSRPVCAALAELLREHIGKRGELVQMNAPLVLLLEAAEWGGEGRGSSIEGTGDIQGDTGRGDASRVLQLYIAQASLATLPSALQDDLPAPDLVREAGKGDIYTTSLWLGLEPTFTPWHRDPNPNIFAQLCSSKTIRLMPPNRGERLFREVQMELTKRGIASGHSRFRGEEMMQGPERNALHDAVWGRGDNGSDAATPPSTEIPTIQEARLSPGDMLFIPKGWWHSVKSGFADGRVNGSANWWFR